MPPRRAAALSASKSLREPSSSPEPSLPPTLSRPFRQLLSSKRPPPSRSASFGLPTSKSAKIEHEPTASSSKLDIIEIFDSSDEDQDDDARIAQNAQNVMLDLADNTPAPPFCSPPVWVHLHMDGTLAFPTKEEAESFWWPAGVVSGNIEQKIPMDVFTLTPIPSSEVRSLRIPCPSPSVVLPMRQPGRFAFSFTLSSYWQSPPESPSNTSLAEFKELLDRLFPRALERMRYAHPAADDSTDEDELPAVISTDGSRSSNQQLDPFSSSENSHAELWQPPEPDSSLTIPGEAVLALWRNKKGPWWPARIIDYLPPTTRLGKPKYRLMFFDDTVCDMPREQFYSWLQDEFHSCDTGKYISSEDMQEGQDENLGDEGFAPIIPAPTPDEFITLPLRHQFAYTLPVLHAIVNKTYVPCRDRHDKFMHGGLQRNILRREGSSIGNMTTATAQTFWDLTLCWALGPYKEDSVAAPARTDDNVSGPSKVTDASALPDLSGAPDPTGHANERPALPLTDLSPHPLLRSYAHTSLRPSGCEEYEAMSLAERREYCLLVLNHEVTLQILLWRHGKRDTLELLSHEQEKSLRDKAEKLAAWTDVAEEVKHMRSERTRLLLPPAHNPSRPPLQRVSFSSGGMCSSRKTAYTRR